MDADTREYLLTLLDILQNLPTTQDDAYRELSDLRHKIEFSLVHADFK